MIRILTLIFVFLFSTPFIETGFSASGWENRNCLCDLNNILLNMKKEFSNLSWYSCIGYKRIYKRGKYLPTEEIYMKVDLHPRKIFLKWIGRCKHGREVIWPVSETDHRLIVKLAFGLIRKKLDPESKRAMRDSLHPVTDIGIKALIKLMDKQLMLAKKYKVKLRCKIKKNKKNLKIEVYFPKDKFREFYCYKVGLLLYPDFLPERIMVWQKDINDDKKDLMLIEDYCYTNLFLKFKDGKEKRFNFKYVKEERLNNGEFESSCF